MFKRLLLAAAIGATLTGCGGLDITKTEPADSGVHLKALDQSTRPQDDFYQFANGGWLNNTEIPEIYSGYTVYHQVYEEAEEALRKIIQNAAKNPGEPGSEAQKIGDFYSSWMDEDAINQLGITPIQPELDLIAKIENRRQLSKVIAKLQREGISTPFGMSVFADLKESNINAVYLGQSGITLPDRDYYLDKDNPNFSKARDALPGYIRDMLVIAGTDTAEAERLAKMVYALEETIATAHWDKVTNRNPEKIYNPYSVGDLNKLGQHFHWDMTRQVLGIQAADKLIVTQPSYFEALDRMLQNISLPTWKAYLTFRVLDSYGSQLDQATADVRFAFRNRLLNGQKEQRPRWKRGVSSVGRNLGEALGKLYVAEYFPPAAKAKMETLVNNVINTLDSNLNDLAWMTPATRTKAKQKLSSFTAKIGYPDVWKDYSNLQIIAGDHLGNLRRSNAWNYQQDIEKIGQPVDRTEWHMTPQTVNAYYNPTQNEIVFPAARLQPPFFQLNADDAINYGAVGGVIGHEISHGFDDSGSKFDGDGNLVNWWTDTDRERFEERTKVLVEQYNQYSPIEGMTINGELTLGENIGDLSGVAMAYRAYIDSLNGQEPPVIDGFTGPQRFFIGYAMSRKGKYHDEALINRLASDPHSPLKYRVNGVYRNLDAFHAAFNTQPGDGMWLPPEDRVRIW